MDSIPSYYYVFMFVTSLAVGIISYPVLIRIAFLKNIVDVPDKERKRHGRATPTLGGIIILAGTMIGYLLWFPYRAIREYGELLRSINDFQHIVAVSIILFLTGLKDDTVGLDNVKKLLIHIICAGIMVGIGDIRITNFHGILGLNEIPYWLSLAISMFLYVVLINAWNIIDGVDGLAGTLAFIVSALLFVFFVYVGQITQCALICAFCGSLAAFLWFNASPAKVYMGTTGANFIGFIVATLLIKFIEVPINEGTSNFVVGIHRPLVSVALVSYPLLDLARVMIIRAREGKNILEGDRNHIHYVLKDIYGWKDRKIVIFIILGTVLCTGVGILLSPYPNSTLFICSGIALSLSLMLKKVNNDKGGDS